MMSGTQGASPGWYADPFRRHQYRYWDGTSWSESVSDEGRTAKDAPVFSPPQPDVPGGGPVVAAATPAPVATGTELLRERVVARPVAAIALVVANVAAGLLIVLGTWQAIVVGINNSSTATEPFGLDFLVATRGSFDSVVGIEVKSMGLLFLVLLVPRFVVGLTVRAATLRHPQLGQGAWTGGPDLSGPLRLFKPKALTAKLVIMTVLSAAITVIYALSVASLSDDAYEIRLFGWIGLVLMVIMLIGDIAVLAASRKDRVRLDRFSHVHPAE